MKKYFIKSLKNLPFGILFAIGIGYIISLTFSKIYGNFLPASPLLTEKYGELKAAEMLAFYSGLIGASFTLTSPLWKIESWSLFKSTALFFTINMTVLLLAGWKMMWFTKNPAGIFDYILIYTLIFSVIWIVSYFNTKKEVEKLNEKIKQIK